MTVARDAPETVALPVRSASHDSLRELAERIDELPGYYVEVIEGALVVSPTPSKKHNGIARLLTRQIERQLPGGKVAHPVSSVEGDDASDDYSSPDLIVVPVEQDYEEGWLYPAGVVDLAVEVISKGNPATDTRVKPGEYARWGISIYLAIDPRDGTMVLQFDPVDGEYQAIHRMRFGDTVTLPEPLESVRIETADFPRYD